ncbi:MAG: hypothetical protein AAGF12_40375, partial [Myxococcota bacterium]
VRRSHGAMGLARIQRRARREEREQALSWWSKQRLPVVPVAVDRVALYTWAEDRKTQLFQIVAERRA